VGGRALLAPSAGMLLLWAALGSTGSHHLHSDFPRAPLNSSPIPSSRHPSSLYASLVWELGVSSVASPHPQYIPFDAMYPERVLLGGAGCCRSHGVWQRSRERGAAHHLGARTSPQGLAHCPPSHHSGCRFWCHLDVQAGNGVGKGSGSSSEWRCVHGDRRVYSQGEEGFILSHRM